MKLSDMLFANAMMGEGGGGGGGGGDFSTAEVTIENTSGQLVPARVPYCNEQYGVDVSDIYTDYSATIKVPLYKNMASIFIDTTGVTVTVSGDISDDGGGYYTVTGNGTFSIS